MATAEVMSERPVIEVDQVVKSYGGLRAVNDCSFTVTGPSITALIGPNGAGKSTMISIIAGSLAPDSGRVRLLGQESRFMAQHTARLGVARTFQIPQEMPRMTVLENLMVAGLNQRGESLLGALLGPRTWRDQERESVAYARDVLGRFHLSRLADEYAANLSGGQKKLLEFARALFSRPRLLLLDEPMAGVNPALRRELETEIVRFPEEGISVLMIAHEMALVERLCRRVIVMAAGRVLADGTFEEIRQNQSVVAAYLGRAENLE